MSAILDDLIGEYAIFHKNGEQISKWYLEISNEGLIDGRSDYYIAGDSFIAIFHKDGRQISDEFGDIYPFGLVTGESDYYLAGKGGQYAIYHKSGKKVSEDIKITGFIKSIEFDEGRGIAEITLEDKKNNIFVKTVEFDPVYPFKEEIIDYTKLLNI
ncbi:MAG: hypothetical protein ACP5KF_07335, partial [Sulfurihydrogenibium sp.]